MRATAMLSFALMLLTGCANTPATERSATPLPSDHCRISTSTSGVLTSQCSDGHAIAFDIPTAPCRVGKPLAFSRTIALEDLREGLGLYCEAIAADPAHVKQTDGSPLPAHAVDGFPEQVDAIWLGRHGSTGVLELSFITAHSYALRVFREEGELRIDYVVF
ncbi:MAG TPA: hypothetical protein VM469_05205 [Pseudoxanthomonas sp.]|jgi:hypothetical protein|nr:hypothetical protein [Pseudoxanthomonas sp.]